MRVRVRSIPILFFSLLFLFTLLGTASGQGSGVSVQAVTQALRSGDHERALSLARALVREQPNDPRAWTLEGIVLSDIKQPVKGLKAFQSALRLQSDFLPALEGAAQIEYNNHHPAAASRLLERLVRLRPDDQTAHAMLGVLSFEKKDCSSTVTHFEKSGEVIHDNLAALTEYGGCLMQLHRPSQAIPVFTRVSALQPADWHSRYNLAVAEYQAHEYAEAVQSLQPLLNETRPNVDALNLAAACFEAQNQTAKAVAALRRGIMHDPHDVRNYLDLATISLDHGSYQVGIDVLNAGLQLMPNSWRLHAERGVLYVQIGKFKEASADFETANHLQPTQQTANVAMGIALIQENHLDRSLSFVRNRLKRSPNDAVLNYLLAEILIRMGTHPGLPEYEEAVRAATHATKIKPDFVLAWDDLAQLELMAGHLDAVIRDSKRAIDADPSDQTAVYHLIVAYRQRHDASEVAVLVNRLAVLTKAAQKKYELQNRVRLIVNSAPPEDSGNAK